MIEHGPIDGIGMGAMTMQFGAVDGVELDGIAVDEAVAFTVKAGRDGRYRVTALCAADGESIDGATDCP
jgi:Cu(I)/Ag(I) efflux system protein CusF